MPQVPLPSVSDRPAGPGSLLGGGGVPIPVQDAGVQQGQQLAGAVGKLGANLTAIGAEMNEEHASATAKAALNEWFEKADSQVRGYRTTIGRQAIEVDGKPVGPGVAPGKVIERVANEIRTTEQGLSSDLAKRVFRDYAERSLHTMRARVYEHEARQIKVHDHAENVAGLALRTDAYAHDGDPAQFAAAMDLAGEISTSAGHGKNQRADLLLKARTALHAGRIDQLLKAQEDPKAADAYLRGLDKNEIDVKVRQRARAQIDTVLKAQVAREVGLNLVVNNGYRTHEARVRAAAAALPQARQDQIAKTALLQIGKEMGIPQQDLEVPGAWQMLLSSPEAMAKLDERILTLDQEILRERYPGQPAAQDPGSGTYKRALDALMEMYRKGEINADQLIQAQRTVDDQIGRQVRQRSVEADQILTAIRQTGLSIDSPEFIAQHSDLRAAAIEHGLLSQARAQTRRQTNEPMYDKLYQLHATNQLGRLSLEQLRVTFMPHLSTVHWREAMHLWQQSQPEQGGPGKIDVGPGMKWHEAARTHLFERGLLKGVKFDANAIPVVDTEDDKETRLWRRVLLDLNNAVGADTWTEDDLKKWLDGRFIRVTVGEDPTLHWAFLATPLQPLAIAERVLLGRTGAEETTLIALQHEYREAVLTGDQHKVDAAYERLTSAEMTMQDGTVVRVGPNTVLGPDGDWLPTRANEFMRDEFRLDLLDQNPRVSPALYNQVHAFLEAAGARDPNKTVSPENRERIDAMFRELDLDMWPPHEFQWQWWNRKRDEEPWKSLAPRKPELLEKRPWWQLGQTLVPIGF